MKQWGMKESLFGNDVVKILNELSLAGYVIESIVFTGLDFGYDVIYYKEIEDIGGIGSIKK